MSWATAYDTIQEAINAASPLYAECFGPRDQVWVKEGTYNISSPITISKVVSVLGGFAGTETSSSQRDPEANPTIINGQNVTRCMTITDFCEVSGFTFRNGDAGLSDGGGIYIDTPGRYCTMWDSWFHPRISLCRFEDCTAAQGGGIFEIASDPTIRLCVFEGNSASQGGGFCSFGRSGDISDAEVEQCIFENNEATGSLNGGGAACCPYNASATFENCLFINNSSANYGGAITARVSGVFVLSCTFSGNTATSNGGAFYTDNCDPYLRSCILWGDSPNEFGEGYSTDPPNVTYSDVQGGYSGTGNINLNPQFVSTLNFRLQPDSPCIDTGAIGDPDYDLDQNDRPADGDNDGTARNDMGAYEMAFADLVIDRLWIDPVRPAPAQSITVKIQVTNQGVAASERVYLDCYINQSYPPTLGVEGDEYERLPIIDAGTTYTSTLTIGYTATGDKRIWAQVDTESQCLELDEGNNIYGPHWAYVRNCRCDLNDSGKCDLRDLVVLHDAWMSVYGGAGWNEQCDLASPVDDVIDYADAGAFAESWLCAE